jgi:predicted NAD-dependent protein-ADP-ribosyltransferase YbiA (DUF1768 family)
MTKKVYFYSHRLISETGPDLRSLSNLYESPFEINSKIKEYWPHEDLPCPTTVQSIENAFQGFKPYEQKHLSIFISTLAAPNEAAALGQGRLKIKKLSSEKKKWFKENIPDFVENIRPKLSKPLESQPRFMLELLRAKFPDENNVLMQFQYEEIMFVEHTENDAKWGDGKDGNGTNYLGKLLTHRLRELTENDLIEIDEVYLDISMKQL